MYFHVLQTTSQNSTLLFTVLSHITSQFLLFIPDSQFSNSTYTSKRFPRITSKNAAKIDSLRILFQQNVLYESIVSRTSFIMHESDWLRVPSHTVQHSYTLYTTLSTHFAWSWMVIRNTVYMSLFCGRVQHYKLEIEKK